VNLAERQLQIIPWDDLRAGGENGSAVVADLRTMLFEEGRQAGDAYLRLENPVVAQGNLFEVAPAVVSVIVAAITDASIPEKNVAMVLDLLGRILGGAPDPSEVAAGRSDLQERCQAEALRGYWSIVKVAANADQYGAHEVAADVLDVLDEVHGPRFLDR
jgi:hypothetical protein